MSLVLYGHPLASFCHKVLIALYENGTPFEDRIVDLSSEESRADLFRFWPIGKMPLLRDEARDSTIPETSIIIEYLEQYYPGPIRLLPLEIDRALQVRLWDRFFDLYVQTPMQTLVSNHMRPEGTADEREVEAAKATLATAYSMIEKQLADKPWISGDGFTMADCAAAPALFYAETLIPFSQEQPNLRAYYDRLLARPSFGRVLEEARPYFKFYPYKERLPARFRDAAG
ncbi:glutathione S-transferase family protein [Rhizobium ruizarguesonis]|jgi:glutathione S-transferase|uniref:Glutathione S-transferase family protein n=1 Tax=Rhizobium ruizarguesonis TaxID=2081791 RepID=A0AAE8QFM3_9HYPH|nr:glutathione S-transferase family protein [Rhizobium ruizarguesonis]MBY5805826.1 glutathione S-transferase family protein [Rhizobium leguminosarum]NKJ73177.1 glutathione S-transferase family protein [Rhizobium leguminosarum bv. viciae]QIO43201.1 glutathione S-transferase family protein [Rhizobium leguminosarum bv. trifolii]MBC2804172.1 glutathione S-transferase family protein [Rhizobium ruizarguesonis]MBY5848800.1 glutathione S-transferase family protein [Rhizobium leguminosarum]